MREIKKHIIAVSSMDEKMINDRFARKVISGISFSTSECEIRFGDGTSFSIVTDRGLDALEMWIPK